MLVAAGYLVEVRNWNVIGRSPSDSTHPLVVRVKLVDKAVPVEGLKLTEPPIGGRLTSIDSCEREGSQRHKWEIMES
jgi:hypothetical protein